MTTAIDQHLETLQETTEAACDSLRRLKAEMSVPDADGLVDGVFPEHRECWASLLDAAKDTQAALGDLIEKLEVAM